MAQVRAKFKVTRIETSMGSVARRDASGNKVKDERGYDIYDRVEQRTIVMSPVFGDKPGSENQKFWDASPSGELKLGTVNPAAWAAFELDGEYYIDFTKAEAQA